MKKIILALFIIFLSSCQKHNILLVKNANNKLLKKRIVPQQNKIVNQSRIASNNPNIVRFEPSGNFEGKKEVDLKKKIQPQINKQMLKKNEIKNIDSKKEVKVFENIPPMQPSNLIAKKDFKKENNNSFDTLKNNNKDILIEDKEYYIVSQNFKQKYAADDLKDKLESEIKVPVDVEFNKNGNVFFTSIGPFYSSEDARIFSEKVIKVNPQSKIINK